MIYTSYFAKYRGANGVSIARTQPKRAKPLKEVDPLKPPRALLKGYKDGEISQEEFARYYRTSVLWHLNPAAWGKHLQGKVLLCWEKPGNFCHRHLIADWLRKAGFEVKEWEETDDV